MFFRLFIVYQHSSVNFEFWSCVGIKQSKVEILKIILLWRAKKYCYFVALIETLECKPASFFSSQFFQPSFLQISSWFPCKINLSDAAQGTGRNDNSSEEDRCRRWKNSYNNGASLREKVYRQVEVEFCFMVFWLIGETTLREVVFSCAPRNSGFRCLVSLTKSDLFCVDLLKVESYFWRYQRN